MLVESQLYRPTKIEGNDQHPASLGGTDVFAQASILGDVRSRPLADHHFIWAICGLGRRSSSAIRGPLNAQKALQGAGIRILTHDHFLADAGGSDAVGAEDLSPSQVACV